MMKGQLQIPSHSVATNSRPCSSLALTAARTLPKPLAMSLRTRYRQPVPYTSTHEHLHNNVQAQTTRLQPNPHGHAECPEGLPLAVCALDHGTLHLAV